jgi:predicted GTPase
MGAITIGRFSTVRVDDPDLIRGKRVLLIEDGPTLTHGEMAYGSGSVAAHHYGAAAVVDPKPFARGSLIETFQRFPEEISRPNLTDVVTGFLSTHAINSKRR